MQGEWNTSSDQLQTCPDWGLLSQLCSHRGSYNTVFCPPDNEGPFKKKKKTQGLHKICVCLSFSLSWKETGFKLHVFIMKERWVVRKEHVYEMESVPAKKKLRGKTKLSQSVSGERTIFS